MGELLLCNEQIAAMPYYIDGLSINIYSIEELNYYIANNVYLLDSDFMSEELCAWLERELGLRTMAEKLRDIMRDNGKLSSFVECILKESYYFTPAQAADILAVLCQMEEKSDFEIDKMRADRLMEKEKYLCSIYAYKHLLTSTDAQIRSWLEISITISGLPMRDCICSGKRLIITRLLMTRIRIRRH